MGIAVIFLCIVLDMLIMKHQNEAHKKNVIIYCLPNKLNLNK
jgi:hypothetical protein